MECLLNHAHTHVHNAHFFLQQKKIGSKFGLLAVLVNDLPEQG